MPSMTISERLLQDIDFEKDKLVSVVGQLRSYNKNVNNKNEDEIENAANRHNTINRNAQEHRTLKLKKTNPSKLIVAG